MVGKILRCLLRVCATLTLGRARAFQGESNMTLAREHADYLRKVRTPHLCIFDSDAACALFVTWNGGR